MDYSTAKKLGKLELWGKKNHLSNLISHIQNLGYDHVFADHAPLNTKELEYLDNALDELGKIKVSMQSRIESEIKDSKFDDSEESGGLKPFPKIS
ncbi:unnamed protein product [marine sediment metagenome]|uniref:Uncharacterized protein n=1 Tax=marine sediment metagenome TaxID=412755 RepID=X1B7J3_9ZZZZ